MPEETEPPVREFADRGTLWLLKLPQNLQGLMRLVEKEIADLLDFTRAERINRSFIPDDLQKQEADLLYRVPYRTGKGEVWVYVLLEHQSRPDRTMGLRLLSYMLQLWETQRRGWQDAKTPVSKWRLHPTVPIVFYTGKRKWSSPISLEALMEAPGELKRFVPSFDSLFLNLHQTEPKVLSSAGSAVAWALRVLQAAEESQEKLASVLSEVVPRLEALPPEEEAQWRRAMQYLYLLVRHKRQEEEQEPLYRVMDEAVEQRHEEIKEFKMTGAQALEARGRKEGRTEGRIEGRIEGRVEGRVEGRREILLEQLEFKFGPLAEQVVTSVTALTDEQMKELSKRVLTAASLTELGL